MSETSLVAGMAPERRHGGWFAIVIIGSVMVLVAAMMLAGAIALASFASTHGANGFLRSPEARLSSQASAVMSASIPVESPMSDNEFPHIRVSVTAESSGNAPLFVGVGPSDRIAEYLVDVHTAAVRGARGNPLTLLTFDRPGNAVPDSPVDQQFWAAMSAGTGTVGTSWLVEPGDWTIVVMNVDGSSPIEATVAIGVEAPWVGPVTAGLIVVISIVLLVGLALIVVGVVGWGSGRTEIARVVLTGAPYPATLTGRLSDSPSQWLWLVKWVLAIPHWIVLSLLWVAFVVTTCVAWFAILFTGRYPRGLFDFNVGVLRWNWRVAFYAYSALGTDVYPPFTLSRTAYPADFDVVYPERLSRGLVLVKSWLLAIPHLLLVAALTGASAWGLGNGPAFWGINNGGVSVLGVLVLVAAVILLFSGTYPRQMFDLVMGINRWGYRVATYVALMRDEYPPFRLDQGGVEPVIDSDHRV